MASILNHSKIVRTNDPEGQGYCAERRVPQGLVQHALQLYVRRGEPGGGASKVAICVRHDGKRVCGRTATRICVQISGYS